MNISVDKNREINVSGENEKGTQNENLEQAIKLEVPSDYSNYTKMIVFDLDGELFWDLFNENDTYVLGKAITQYQSVPYYIWLTNGENDFRSKTRVLYFNENEDASDQITPEEISGVNTVIALLEEEITKVNNLNITATKENKVTTVTITDKDGELHSVEILDGEDGAPGQDYVITQEDYDEIASVVLENIQIPSNTSDLVNNSGFIDNTVDDLVNYYKKSETYNKDEIDGKVSSVYKYRGTVATYQDLPSTGLTVGDVYNVEADGSNYAWTGSTWDKLGGDVDLSNYYNKTQTDNLLSGKVNTSALNDYYNKTQTDTLLGGKQASITSQNKLSADLVDDTSTTNKFVTASDKSNWNGKVSLTDYAGEDTAGVIKAYSNYGTSIDNGRLRGVTRTYAQYQNANNLMLISKVTLDNVLTEKIGTIETILETLDIGSGV